MHNRRLGIDGENMACDFLQKRGYKIIDRNYRTRRGEIDIIAEKDKTIIFVEVKARKNIRMGNGAESVTNEKIRHMVYAINMYLYQNRLEDRNVRLDAIEINGSTKDCHFRINHIKNILG